ncbi:hypothetical protein TCA2_5157 [Paenibacillus sp. TCA20]|uniref:response regulator transcription factor n=1 Tax=Paenibacillus sp. TCA20 TaxID=1499968 RepID=UPI0004D3B2E0|nr:response regulator transcription factor [Paenibacillus sp. TCA20]GAK42665.1 hypothetical protein TCA2_5157 [Paenibacillus sp. TCA20]
MYSVILVDDEPMIREGLKTIIDWEAQGYEVIDTASNGREAVEKYHELQPDLMILDIRMPGMTGLEVIELLFKEGKKGHFLILSGHADFDYAKKAISFGVDGYLLKPVDEEEMMEELERIKKMLDKEEKIKQRSSNEELFYREHLIESIIFDGQVWEDEQLKEWGLYSPSYQVLLLELYDDSTLFLTEVKREVAEMLNASQRGVVFNAGKYVGILLREPVLSKEDARRLYEGIVTVLKRYAAMIYIAAGRPVERSRELEHSYREALITIERRFFAKDRSILLASDVHEPDDKAEQAVTMNEHELADKLYYALDIRSKDLLTRVLSEIEEIVTRNRFSEGDIKKVTAQIAALALNKLSLNHEEAKSIATEHTAMLAALYRLPTLYDLLETLNIQFVKVISQLGGNSKDTVIKQMIDFIKRNPGNHLKLEVLAEVFNYNSSYLGKLFKNYTGESFNVFVDKVRMERAKELLSEGLKVHQVSATIGYANVDYFHSKFKKYVGVSPSTYREQSRDQS